MRETWTDDRMDDLNGQVSELRRRVDNGFNGIDASIRELREDRAAEFTAVRAEMSEGFEAVDKGFETVALRDPVDERFASVDRRFDSVDRRLDSVDQRFLEVDHRFDLVDRRFEALSERIQEFGQRFDRLEKGFERLDNRIDGLYRVVIGFCGVTFATLLALFATQL